MTESERLLGGLVVSIGIAVYVLLTVNPGGAFVGNGVGTPRDWVSVLLLQLVGLGVFSFCRRVREN